MTPHRRMRVRSDGLPYAGLYDTVVDTSLATILDVARAAGIDVKHRKLLGRDARLIVRELAATILEAIESRLNSDAAAGATDINFVNHLLAIVHEANPEASDDVVRLLPEVLECIGPETSKSMVPPDLSAHGLLTGREGRDNLLVQLKRELATCDRVDWLVSFIKLAAVKMLEGDIALFLERGGEMRIVTTAYMGATDPVALERLAAISCANKQRMKIRFSRESGTTRLHAKAYIHHRNSGFGSAYIGSANLSRPALTEGLEWTVRLSQAASPGLWSKIEETFDQWWGDPEFTEYGLTPGHPSHAQFRNLVAREKGAADGKVEGELASLPIFDLAPKPFQQEILERISVERSELGIQRHLIVAATGTGKTMIAAFDYRAFAEAFRARTGRVPRLLYVAHSERILSQARLTFAQVVRDLNFGGFLVGGKDDRPCDALFASIQSWTTRIGVGTVSPDHFDYVVVDEVHRGEAPTWRKFLKWIRPESLLGLTATPERADGLDIRQHFENRTTAEVRLPDAITRRLLVPFHYFGVTDEIDLTNVEWTRRGGYTMSMVEQAYLQAGSQWVENVRKAIVEYVAEPLRMRAVAFCSGVAHARDMAKKFEDLRGKAEGKRLAGLRCAALAGDDPIETREQVIGELRQGKIQILFVADLLNEGVDIPEIDVVLFMRPTDSLTIFVQQLGRGLRLCPWINKDCLTVLDFVGHYRREFRFGDRLGALLADRSSSIDTQVRSGFTSLPPGCSVTLERIARDRVLAHIHAQNRVSLNAQLVESFVQLRERLGRAPTQSELIETTGREPRAFYKGDTSSTWAGIVHAAQPAEWTAVDVDSLQPFISALRAVAALTDRKLALYGLESLELIERDGQLSSERLLDRRLHVLLVEFGTPVKSSLGLDRNAGSQDVVAVLSKSRVLRFELRSLLQAIAARATVLSLTSATKVPEGVPLEIHRTYTTKQIFIAFGWEPSWQTQRMGGADWIEEHDAYIMRVTLEKDEESFTERTRYRDYAFSPTQFHWQSKNTARPDRGEGVHISDAMNGTGTMWLFVRRAQKDEFGTEPFMFLGAFRPTKIEGMYPMSVTGELASPTPAAWFELAARAR